MKSVQDEETYIGILKDMLLSRMILISWPSTRYFLCSCVEYHQRDVYITNLTKQKISQYDGKVPIDVIAQAIMRELFYT